MLSSILFLFVHFVVLYLNCIVLYLHCIGMNSVDVYFLNAAVVCCRILWTTYVDSFEMVGHQTALYLFNVLLWILQVLHVFWFVLIMRVAITALISGKVRVNFVIM